MIVKVDESKVYFLLESDQKIKAIRFVMDQTGIRLSEAKAYVESLPPRNGNVPRTAAPIEVAQPKNIKIDDNQVRQITQQAGKITAIQYVIKQTGIGLKEAKDYVEHLSPPADTVPIQEPGYPDFKPEPPPQTVELASPPTSAKKQSFVAKIRKLDSDKIRLIYFVILLILFLVVYLAFGLNEIIFK